MLNKLVIGCDYLLYEINIDILPKVRYIGYVNYTKPWIHFPRQTNEYVLYIIENGTMYIQEDDKKYTLKRGDIFLLDPNRMHKGYKEDVCSYYYVHFKHDDLYKINSKSVDELLSKRKATLESNHLLEDSPNNSNSVFAKYINIDNTLLLMDIFYTLKNAINDYYMKQEDYKIYSSCKLLEILIKICREYVSTSISNENKPLPRVYYTVQNIIEYLNHNYQNKVTSNDIEEIFELNYDYLNRSFQKITGYSIVNYLNIVRINNAKDMIATTTLKVSEIGYLVGIDDPYYFSRLFKKHTGVSPSKYRN